MLLCNVILAVDDFILRLRDPSRGESCFGNGVQKIQGGKPWGAEKNE